jgi:hypothetical protein
MKFVGVPYRKDICRVRRVHFQQTINTSIALLADIFLYTYEPEFL